MGESASKDNIKRVERELAKEDTLLANMIEQAPGMLGMAFMFITTILMGLWLQPWFDSAGLQAFGDSGSTQARWVGLQLVSIFVFTFLILWLAKKHLQHVIKYGLLFVLFLALCYTTVPGAHILLVPDVETEPFEFTTSNEINEEIVSLNSDGTMITNVAQWRIDNSTNNTFVISKRAADTTLDWSVEVNAMPGQPNVIVMEGDYAYTATNGIWIWSFDKETGDTLSRYACFDEENWDGTDESLTPIAQYESCFAAVEVVENPVGGDGDQKGALYILTGGSELIRTNTLHGEAFANTSSYQTTWAITQLQLNNPDVELLHMSQYDEDSMLLASSLGATMILLETYSDPFPGPGSAPPNWVESCTSEWIYEIQDDDNRITAFNIVESMWDDDDKLIMAGFEDGMVESWIIDDDYEDIAGPENQWMGEFEEEDRFLGNDAFEGPISAIDSFDLDGENGNELWIADADGIHGLFYKSLIEYATFDFVLDEQSKMSSSDWKIQAISAGTWEDNVSTQTSMIVVDGEFDPDTMYNSYGIQWDDMAFFLGIGLAIILMAALMIHPEWYVVNTVGVLVGAGVIVMLGVTFVPSLIVIFMVLAAIYDAWAVYRSKHMLDLADTMIGLNLPILLVAPQDSGYSMLEEKDSIRPPEEAERKVESVAASTVKAKKRKKSKDAMFMGLGDVIFPGMLVVSCVNFISSGGLEVGISALIGGLVGYFVLMGYVASGRPQAGLPLLNGGAILGYIIGGLIFVGSAAFSFGISF